MFLQVQKIDQDSKRAIECSTAPNIEKKNALTPTKRLTSTFTSTNVEIVCTNHVNFETAVALLKDSSKGPFYCFSCS